MANLITGLGIDEAFLIGVAITLHLYLGRGLLALSYGETVHPRALRPSGLYVNNNGSIEEDKNDGLDVYSLW